MRREKMGSRNGEDEKADNNHLPLFETIEGKGKVAHRICASTILVGICCIWLYRLLQIFTPVEDKEAAAGRWTLIGMFMAELCFGLYWIITQAIRWNVMYRYPYKDRLSKRYEDKLPGVDIFVCTADPTMEPPAMVVNTALSLMASNYPPEKLSVYLSDDGGSEFTFYAMIEASQFSKYWIPFCKKFNIEPRAPEAYFAQQNHGNGVVFSQEWVAVKKLYEDMKSRIESAMENDEISQDIKSQNNGFSEWKPQVTKQDHQTILKIIIDGKDANSVDKEGCRLPTLVYVAREKRPGWPHNFKAGAMNALIRVSSETSKGDIILNLDCDMYANDANAIREALCFFMDEKKGHEVAYVQHPQNFNNVTKNDLYANCNQAINQVELACMGGYGASLYCGTGCFHRRESLAGKKYTEFCYEEKRDINGQKSDVIIRTVDELEETCKVLANCSYEKGTRWGQEMGLIYGCPVEDIVTGLTIQCRGWKSIYYNPKREAFLGVAPITLEIALVQYKRWTEGLFQIFSSKYCPFIYGHGKIKLGAQMGYCVYLLWAPLSLPTLYYVIVPPLCLLHGIPLFPKVSSLWFTPFAYVFMTKTAYSLVEAMSCGSSVQRWWNVQRMMLIRRTTSFLFGFIDVIMKQLGLSQTKFDITTKVVTDDVTKRYEQEIIEFGSSSIMFTIVATLAMLNLISLVGAISKMVIFLEFNGLGKLISQAILCGLMVLVNLPVYQALFVRKDKGSLPFNVMFKSIVLASLACLMPINYNC